MFVNRFVKFLTTEKGRNFTLNSVVAAGVTTFCVNYVPNTILVDKFKSLLMAYKQGEEREVPEKLQRRFGYAMDLCKCTNYEKNFLESFMTFGFDTMELGSTKSRFGAHIGIPTNYLYDKISDIERPDMRVRYKEIKWSSEDGITLQNSLVLTEMEQVFGLARSILMVKSHKLLLESFYPPVCIMAMYGAGYYINQKMRLHGRPLGMRLCLYTILSVFGYGLYAFMKDFTQVYHETNADKQLAEIAPEFIDVGITFYDKLLKKNVALRNLTGENIYTAAGNENYLLRQKSLPLTIRKSFFEMKKKELEEAASAAPTKSAS
ncbi:hypothetical protein HA402_006860 [Bradysia odoriphaga]|nr:hypothetical protein HA402_006860 [Bradysia odoriphaga]